MFLFLALIFSSVDGIQVLEGTEVFFKPGLKCVVVTKPGAGFLLDKAGKRLLSFSFPENKIKQVARAGEGPGELQTPIGLTLAQNDLFVADRDRFHLFSRDGVFLRSIRTPGDLVVMRAGKGWLGLLGFKYDQADLPLSLFWLDDPFTQRVPLATWQKKLKKEVRLVD